MKSTWNARFRGLVVVIAFLAVQSARAQQAPTSGSPVTPPVPAAPSGTEAAPVPAPHQPVAQAGAPLVPPQLPATRFVLNNLVAFRYNALGLEDQIRTGLQLRLYDGESALTRDNFFFVGFTPRINPAYLKFGQAVEIQPLSIFNLRLSAELLSFFSTFGFLQSFSSPNAEYGDKTLLKRREAKLNYATEGLHFTVEPLLQLKFGKIAVRNKVSFEYWSMGLRNGDRVWYDATLDTLVPGDGWVIANDFDALYVTGGPVTAGLRYSMVSPRYRPSHYGPGEEEARSNGHHRVGPLLAYTFYDEGISTFNKPTVILILNWYVSHRWRTGADTSRGLPYFVIGFASQSDLL